jgi:SET domain-containing protein
MDSPKIKLKRTKKFGLAVFATKKIKKNEAIAQFDGKYYPENAEWTKFINDHVIQCAPKLWRDSDGIAKFINHSCEPNCGIKRKFNVVAMRDIKKGEQITWDYEMTENSSWWVLKCKCGSPICRKRIGAYKNMPAEIRKKYKGYISSWLTKAELAKKKK